MDANNLKIQLKELQKKYDSLLEKHNALNSLLKQSQIPDPEPQYPKYYREWRLSQRKTSAGKIVYNLQKSLSQELQQKAGKKRLSEYLGKLNDDWQQKANAIIDKWAWVFASESQPDEATPEPVHTETHTTDLVSVQKKLNENLLLVDRQKAEITRLKKEMAENENMLLKQIKDLKSEKAKPVPVKTNTKPLSDFEKITAAGFRLFLPLNKAISEYINGNWEDIENFQTKKEAREAFKNLLERDWCVSTSDSKEWHGDGADMRKLRNAGFTFIRADKSSLSIREPSGKGGWKNLEKCESEEALQARFLGLLQDPKTLNG